MLCDGIHPCFEVSPHSQLGDAGNMRLPNASPLAEPTSLAAAPAVWTCLCGPLAKPLPASVRTMLLQSDTQLGRQSYYEASVLREPPLPLLQGQGDAGVLVAGAGFAGCRPRWSWPNAGCGPSCWRPTGFAASRPAATADRPSSAMPAASGLSSSNWVKEAARQAWAMSLKPSPARPGVSMCLPA